jgi:hypothetical protein
MSTGAQLETEAEHEFARFLASQPLPAEIIAFRPSVHVTERMYELVEADREGTLREAERQELETYLNIEHLMRLVKAEVHR